MKTVAGVINSVVCSVEFRSDGVDCMRFFRILMPGMIVLLSACATTPSDGTTLAADAQACEEPRPQVCTMDYRPVCASLADGSVKTYSNGCSACGDASVSSWTEGACPE